jgi:hypothetical protein
MSQKKYISFILLTVIFILVMISDFPVFFHFWNDLFYDLYSKYPVKIAVILSIFRLFCIVYTIFYPAILLSILNKPLLKLNNGIIFFLLLFLTIFFVGVMVSDWPGLYLGYGNYYNHKIFGNFFYNVQWREWSWLRLAYSIFYTAFLLLIINTRLLKLPNKIFISIILLAGISNIIWVVEVLIRGWGGLYWLEYIHIAFFIIGILFLIWIVVISNNEKHIKNIIFYGVLYTLFLFTFIFLLKLTYGHIKINNDWGWIFRESRENLTHYIFNFILQIATIFLINNIIIKYEKVIISLKIICINLFLMIIIPVYTFLSSFVILNLNIGYPYLNAVYFDPIDWIKLGNIIFGFVIYECLFIAYIKQKKC